MVRLVVEFARVDRSLTLQLWSTCTPSLLPTQQSQLTSCCPVPVLLFCFSISLDVVEFRPRVICLGMVSFGGSKRKFTQISADENGCCDLLSFV